LAERVITSYRRIAATDAIVELSYLTSWTGTLAEALSVSRHDDVRRGVSTVGPHRDDLQVYLNDMPARTHASQGEQRSLVLALRLASHDVVTTATGSAPVLILDDVLSELDDDRATALLASLPPGQTVITSAVALPSRVRPDLIIEL
jgi:DNA replication and repair protein RecF